jgi:hypothetical protein
MIRCIGFRNIVIGALLTAMGLCHTYGQHGISFSLSNSRPAGSGSRLNAFAGLGFEYSYRFSAKTPQIFCGVLYSYFPGRVDGDSSYLIGPVPFKRIPSLAIGALVVGARQNLRQRGKAQPYVSLSAGAYWLKDTFQGFSQPNQSNTVHQKLHLGVAPGCGVRYLLGKKGFLGLDSRLHLIGSIPFSFDFAYFDAGVFGGFTF